jgi:hypothetical protein
MVKSVTITMAVYLAILVLALVFIHDRAEFVKTVVVATCALGMSMLYAIALELDIIKEWAELIAVRLDAIKEATGAGKEQREGCGREGT